jgi:aldose 1-epimerase
MIQLTDGDLSASIDTSCGNNCHSLTYLGVEFIHTPADWKPPALAGVPLLAPWANRIDGESYLANGWRYFLNSALGNLRYDGNHLPIHGLLLFTDRWKVIRQDSASVTSRLEFWRVPEWMAQFPFAHSIEMTHRLGGGSLEIKLAVENISEEPMPLCIGFHPYYRLEGSSRNEWRLKIPARQQMVLSEKTIPTGERKTIEPGWRNLAGESFDTVFTGLTGEDFAVEDGARQLAVRFGAKYPVGVVYAPPEHDFVCFEPMTAVTNAFNSQDLLQHVPSGETWSESFWITPGAGAK